MTIRVITKSTPDKRSTPVYPWLVDCPPETQQPKDA